MSESDGIEEAVSTELRLMLIAAGQLGELYKRSREQHLQELRAEQDAAARDMQNRYEAEARTAHASLRRVDQEQWWQEARPRDIAEMYQTAHAWSSEFREAEAAKQRIEAEVRQRYGFTIDGMDPVQAAEALEEHARSQERRAREDEREAHGHRDEAGEWERRADEGRDAGQPAQEERMRANARASLARDDDPNWWDQARTELAWVDDPRWWDQARTEDIAGMYQTAHAWQSDMAEAQRARWRIEDEVRERYGIDLDGRDPRTLSAEELEQAANDQQAQAVREQDRADASKDESELHRDRADDARARGDHVAAADHEQAETELNQEAGQSWDSAERRHEKAEDLRARGVDERDVEARMTADRSFGRPPEEAVESARSGARRAPRAAARRQRLRERRGPGMSR